MDSSFTVHLLGNEAASPSSLLLRKLASRLSKLRCQPALLQPLARRCLSFTLCCDATDATQVERGTGSRRDGYCFGAELCTARRDVSSARPATSRDKALPLCAPAASEAPPPARRLAA